MPVSVEQFKITMPNVVSWLSTIPEFGQILEFSDFYKSKMADGSHLGFIQKPVTVEQFEITKPNLVSRLSTNPEYSQILKFPLLIIMYFEYQHMLKCS